MSDIIRGYTNSFKTSAASDVTAQAIGGNRFALDVLSSAKEEAIRLDDAGGGITYVGWAIPGSITSSAIWKLMRMTESSGDLTIEWADGNVSYDNVWNNRASLSYS